MKRPTRILLLDDHDLAKNNLVSMLSHEPDLLVAGHARTVTKAISLAARHPPDLALIEMQLPDASGMEACQRLLAVAPQVRILVLTRHADDTMVAGAIRSGTHGYHPQGDDVERTHSRHSDGRRRPRISRPQNYSSCPPLDSSQRGHRCLRAQNTPTLASGTSHHAALSQG